MDLLLPGLGRPYRRRTLLRCVEGQNPNGHVQGRYGDVVVVIAKLRLRDEEHGDIQQRRRPVSATRRVAQTAQDRVDVVDHQTAQSSHRHRSMVHVSTRPDAEVEKAHYLISVPVRTVHRPVRLGLRQPLLLHPTTALLSLHPVRVTTGRHPSRYAGRRGDAMDHRLEHEGEPSVVGDRDRPRTTEQVPSMGRISRSPLELDPRNSLLPTTGRGERCDGSLQGLFPTWLGRLHHR